jgi:DNA-binding response OmpR family regulator
MDLAIEHNPDLVVLDMAMPGMDGLRYAGSCGRGTTPILVLSVRSGDADKIAALDAGADDWSRSRSRRRIAGAGAGACCGALSGQARPR